MSTFLTQNDGLFASRPCKRTREPSPGWRNIARDEDTVLAPGREQHLGEAVGIDAARFEYVIIWRDRGSTGVALCDGAPLGVQHASQYLVADETGSAFGDDLVPEARRRRVLDGGLEPAAAVAVLSLEPPDRAITGLRVVLR